MRDITQSPHVCSVDPISLGGLALGSLVGGGLSAAMGSAGKGASAAAGAPTPTEAPTPPPQQSPQGTAKRGTSAASTFIGNVPTIPTTGGGKTLLGQ